MGFFAKLKEFGSKIINKIRKPKLDPNLIGRFKRVGPGTLQRNQENFNKLSPEEQQKRLEKANIPKIKLLNN